MTTVYFDNWSFWQLVILTTYHFDKCSFCHLVIFKIAHLWNCNLFIFPFWPLVIFSNGHFVKWSFWLLVILKNGYFLGYSLNPVIYSTKKLNSWQKIVEYPSSKIISSFFKNFGKNILKKVLWMQRIGALKSQGHVNYVLFLSFDNMASWQNDSVPAAKRCLAPAQVSVDKIT